MAVNRKLLTTSYLFSSLSDHDVGLVLAAAKPSTRAFRRGDVIWREGAVMDGLGVLEEGVLLFQRYHTDGKIQLARIHTPPDILNLEASVSRKKTSPATVAAATDGAYIWFTHAGLFDNRAIPERTQRKILMNLLSYLADDCIRFMNKSDILSRRTVRERAMLFLGVLRAKQGDTVDTGMTQEEFAQYLCVDRSTLSNELNKMRKEGLIDFRGRKYTLHY
ncbi:MAG: Crp/Fnr family transcriptional regulator [Clostridiales Family XIII bacterium]|jgi:CRP-like cAMP-binding protein|nr:Crp/Fnr family transcriptional regulator [Clostridiales Family XIII bacterium]